MNTLNNYNQLQAAYEAHDLVQVRDIQQQLTLAEIRRLWQAGEFGEMFIVVQTLPATDQDPIPALKRKAEAQGREGWGNLLEGLALDYDFLESSAVLSERAQLEQKIQELRQRFEEIRSTIETLRKSETWQLIQQEDDWEVYFERMQLELDAELSELAASQPARAGQSLLGHWRC